jgi:hypothetical protein
MTGLPASAPDSWENEGQQLAPLFDTVCAAVIAGTDANAAAQTAIGIARVQGARRRVAIADLIGEAPALEALNRSDDPHGIADSFLYGVSLNRIARQVNAAGSVFLMPSGTEAVAHEAVYNNERWRRLAAGFEQVGALLLIVAVPGTPGFAELCGYVGAVMPVGDTRFPTPVGIAIIAPPAAPAPPPPPPPPEEHVARAREAAIETSGGKRRKLIAAVVALFAVAIAIGAFWPKILPLLPASIASWFAPAATDSTALLVAPTPMDTAPVPAPVTAPVSPPDSGDTTAVTASAATMATTPTLPIANEADSATAARYAIFYTSANTRAQAITDERLTSLKAMAISVVTLDGAVWYRVFIGASSRRDSATALLARLKESKVLSGGNVISVPFALRLERGLNLADVGTRIADFGKRGIHAYALRQADGTATIYTGAFESPTEANTLADSLRVLGVPQVLAYRTGRGY